MNSWPGTFWLIAKIGLFTLALFASTLPMQASANSTPYLFQIHGSNTIGANLGPALVEGYLIQKGCNEVTIVSRPQTHESIINCTLNGKPVAIRISAQGSSTGFKAMEEGVAQIIASSRKAKQEEAEYMAHYGNLLDAGSEHVVALDALAIIVNANNPVENMTVNEVAQIFTGVHSNWKKFNGKNQPINLLVRDRTSGTRDSFSNLVLKQGEAIYQRHQPVHSNKQTAEEVFQDSRAIAFTSVYSIGENKALAISIKPGASPVTPTPANITTEEYPLTRELYFYMPVGISNTDARDFLAYTLSEDAQKIVAKTGFIPLSIEKVEQQVKGKSRRYQRAVRRYQRLNINVRFRDKDRYINNFGLQRIKSLAQYMKDNDGSLLLLGNYGHEQGKKSRQFASERAAIVSRALIDAGVSKSRILVRGMGDEHSLSMESMSSRQAGGVRVEVWYKPWFSGE